MKWIQIYSLSENTKAFLPFPNKFPSPYLKKKKKNVQMDDVTGATSRIAASPHPSSEEQT